MPKFAFRCKNCGSLEPPGAAGENELPAACHICGHGVAFDPLTGAKSLVPVNWQVLAELDAEERDAILKFHRLTVDDIARPRKAKKPEEAPA